MSFLEGKLSEIINTTHVGIALALAKDVGILKTLIDAHIPMTSHEIAKTKDLKERYVREILNCLTAGDVIHVSTNSEGILAYYLQDEEKKVFKTSTMALISFPVEMIKVYDLVKRCFDLAKPAGMFSVSDACNDDLFYYNLADYLDYLFKYVDGLHADLEAGIEITQLGGEEGILLSQFSTMFPNSSFVATEKDEFTVDLVKALVDHIPNVTYEVFDLCDPNSVSLQQYDWVYCFNVIHKIPHPIVALHNIRKLLKPDGVFFMIEKVARGNPMNYQGDMELARMYALSPFFCLPESLVRDPSADPLGPCWEIKSALQTLKDVGFDVQESFLRDEVLFVCHV